MNDEFEAVTLSFSVHRSYFPMPLHSPDDIAACCRVSRATVYRSHRELRARNLIRPLALRFPLEEPDALRLIAYIKNRSRKKIGN